MEYYPGLLGVKCPGEGLRAECGDKERSWRLESVERNKGARKEEVLFHV